MKINIIVAMADNRAIGFHNQLLYHIPEDMKRFKGLTIGHTVVMGRRTYASLPNGALPHRRNIVLSRTTKSIEGCDVYTSLEEALQSCTESEEVFIIGGESVYRQAIPMAHRIYLTLVEKTPEQADAFFPNLCMTQWNETTKEKRDGFSFIQYDRK
ncbi:MAG: dihydrofolate reductase [Prevotella sp.]|jgi:dihydrofolate reductase